MPGVFGYSHLTSAYPGGQAEYIAVPFADVSCLKIPDRLPDDRVLFLSDIVCTGRHATELGRVGEGETVAVWGCGPVDLMLPGVGSLPGGQVIGIDRIPHRLYLGWNRGSRVINFDKDDVLETLKETNEGPRHRRVHRLGGVPLSQEAAHKIERLETDAIDALTECIRAGASRGGCRSSATSSATPTTSPSGH